CSARSKPWRSFLASNCSRRPSPLMIDGNFSSTVSRVEKRSPQASHSRRRRMVAPSSDTRESITRVSLCWQKGQCIGFSSAGAARERNDEHGHAGHRLPVDQRRLVEAAQGKAPGLVVVTIGGGADGASR